MALMTVFGGTGFLGRRIVRRLVGAGEVVRVATRHPARAGAAVSPAEARRTVPIIADVRDEDSVAAAVAGADGIVNAVSAYVEKGDVTYRAVHVQGALNVAKACALRKVGRLVHISGIGADPASSSAYIRARGQGEQEVRQAFTQATVLRPSVMFSHDEGILHALVALARASPVVPSSAAAARDCSRSRPTTLPKLPGRPCAIRRLRGNLRDRRVGELHAQGNN